MVRYYRDGSKFGAWEAHMYPIQKENNPPPHPHPEGLGLDH